MGGPPDGLDYGRFHLRRRPSACRWFSKLGNDYISRLSLDFETIQIISPLLHHDFAFFRLGRAVVGPAIGILHSVSQLMLNIVHAIVQHSIEYGSGLARKP